LSANNNIYMRLWKIRFPKNSLIYYIVLIGTGQQKLNSEFLLFT